MVATTTKPRTRAQRRAPAAPRGSRDAQARAAATAPSPQVVQVLSAQELTLGEAELFEEATGYAPLDFLRVATSSPLTDFAGQPILAPDEDGVMQPVYKSPPNRFIAVLHWLYMRRESPNYTLEQARQKSPADFVVDGNPTPAAATS